MRAAAGRQRSLGGDAAAGDEERSDMAGLRRRDEQTPLHRLHAREPFELPADELQRLEPVTQARRVLESLSCREVLQPAPKPRQRERRAVELIWQERTRCELCA